MWGCSNHILSKDNCDSKRYTESQIYGAFMRMFNKLRRNSRTILRSTLHQLDYVMTYKKKHNQQAIDLNKSILQLLEKKTMLDQLRSKNYLPESLFQSQCRDIEKQLRELRQEKDILFDTQLENTYAQIKKLTAIIEDYREDMNSFDEAILDFYWTIFQFGV